MVSSFNENRAHRGIKTLTCAQTVGFFIVRSHAVLRNSVSSGRSYNLILPQNRAAVKYGRTKKASLVLGAPAVMILSRFYKQRFLRIVALKM